MKVIQRVCSDMSPSQDAQNSSGLDLTPLAASGDECSKCLEHEIFIIVRLPCVDKPGAVAIDLYLLTGVQ